MKPVSVDVSLDTNLAKFHQKHVSFTICEETLYQKLMSDRLAKVG